MLGLSGNPIRLHRRDKQCCLSRQATTLDSRKHLLVKSFHTWLQSDAVKPCWGSQGILSAFIDGTNNAVFLDRLLLSTTGNTTGSSHSTPGCSQMRWNHAGALRESYQLHRRDKQCCLSRQATTLENEHGGSRRTSPNPRGLRGEHMSPLYGTNGTKCGSH